MNAADSSTLTAKVRSQSWYHTIELRAGVVTPGRFDLRPVAARLPWPELTGLRCLDVGTFDGFWAFEMESRGAAEVVAIDELDVERWDWPASSSGPKAGQYDGGPGFEIAKEELGSAVTRVHCNAYEVDRERLGTFDVVFVGSLLVHFRDPIGGLAALRRVCNPGGVLLVVDRIDLALSIASPRGPLARLDGRGRPWWWRPNLAALQRMVESAGFRPEGAPQRISLPAGQGYPRPRVHLQSLRRRMARESLMTRWMGEPHGVVRARCP